MNLHIVEITQSYRLGDPVHFHSLSTHSRNYSVIQTTTQVSTLTSTHSRNYSVIQTCKTNTSNVISTHSRNYSVIQTLKHCLKLLLIYTQQKLLSHIDRKGHRREYISTHSRNYSVIQTRLHKQVRLASTHSRNYSVIQTYQTMITGKSIYTQQKLLSHIDSYNTNIIIFY